MSTTFIKVDESFICGQCGAHIVGNGYTNHCPHCLWSKHVDVHPGDRSALCGGMMEPRTVERKNGEWKIVHVCVVCGHTKRNVVADADDPNLIASLSAQHAL
jgi:rubrerythrin